jgi:hypothetical protein
MVCRELKKKLRLIDTCITLGTSYRNNCEVCIIPALSVLNQEAYICDCYLDGTPLPIGEYFIFVPSMKFVQQVSFGHLYLISNKELYIHLSEQVASLAVA